MRKQFIISLFICSVNYIFSQVPTFQWAAAMGSSQTDEGLCVKLDASGNVITTGYFQAVSDFDPGASTYSLSSFGVEDVFISKLDASGNFIWSKQIGGKGSDKGTSIALDGLGNIYVTGFFSDTSDFDPGPGTFTLASNGMEDIFISKLDASGNFIWAKQIGGIAIDKGLSIGLGPSNTIYVSGYFNNTADFDSGPSTFTMSSNGMEDIFVSKLDASGNFVWAKQIGGTQSDEALSMAVDASGNVNTAGYFNDAVDFDPGMAVSTLTANGAKDIFYSKLDALGNFIWGLGLGSYYDDVCYSIALDAGGNLYTTGSYSGYSDFDPGTGSYMINYLGNTSSIFISKLDPSGNFVWAYGMNSWWANEGHAIYADAAGNIFTTGVFSNTMDFDPGPGTFYMTPTPVYFGPTDIYVCKYTTTGNFVWAKSFGGSFFETCNSAAVDINENIYITGSFPLTADFDPGLNTYGITANSNSNDIFINKLGPCMSTPPTPVNTTPINDQSICSGLSTTLSASGAGNIYWYGSPTSTVILNIGPTFITPPLSTGSYTYYVLANTCTVSLSRTPITVTVNACVGINELEKTNYTISLYPNPNNGSFILKVENEIKDGELIIFNSIGQEVHHQKINEGTNNINTKALSTGLYHYVLLQNKQKINSGKFVIE